MASFDTAFSRLLLAQVMPTVREHTTAEQRKETWTYHHGRGHWEFHGPDKFYWHGGASSAYEARYKGWCAWLEARGIKMDDNEEEGL